MFPVQTYETEPPAPPWTSDAGPDATLPSWMAPPHDDDAPLGPAAPDASATNIDDPEAAAAEAALYAQATRLSLPPMTPPPPADAAQQAQLAAQQVVDLTAELEATRSQLEGALNEVAQFRQRLIEDSEQELVRLALAIAERVVGRELKADSTLIGAWAREGVQALVGDAPVAFTVSDDVKATLDQCPDVPADLVEVDPKLPPASCRVQGTTGAVDAGLCARLDAVTEALGLGDRPPHDGPEGER